MPPGRPQPTPLRPPPLLRDKASMPCAPCSLGHALSIDMLRASAERQAGKGVVCLWSRHAAQPSPAAQPGAPGVACRFGAAARRALLPARLSADAVAGVRAPSASEQRCARLQGARGAHLAVAGLPPSPAPRATLEGSAARVWVCGPGVGTNAAAAGHMGNERSWGQPRRKPPSPQKSKDSMASSNSTARRCIPRRGAPRRATEGAK